MKKTICVVTFVMIYAILSNPLFALIEGRVEGTVKDKDSGDVLGGAKIELFQWYSEDGISDSLLVNTNQSNEKGIFSINIKRPAKYYLKVSRQGYVQFLPDYYYGYLKDDVFPNVAKIFQIGEGQIKHIQIELERGGKISGTIQGKDSSGTVPVTASIILYRKSLDEELFNKENFYKLRTISSENGDFSIDGLEASDDYFLEIINWEGMPNKVYNSIEIKKGSTINISETFDFTDSTGIYGTISINGKPPRNGEVILTKREPDSLILTMCSYFLKKNDGNYRFRALSPGGYSMEVGVLSQDRKIVEKKFYVEVKKGVSTLMDVTLSNGDE